MLRGEWLRFDVGGRGFGLPLESIAEVTSALRPRLIPLVPPQAAGVVNHRGEPLTVVDGGALVAGQSLLGHRHMIVLQRATLRLGLLVSGVLGIERELHRAVEVENPSREDGEAQFADWVLLRGEELGLLRTEPLLERTRTLLFQRIEGGSLSCHDAF